LLTRESQYAHDIINPPKSAVQKAQEAQKEEEPVIKVETPKAPEVK
jgi:hypothetical protein